ncbi:MAG: hypothetical protein F2792_07310, partial [Actinobacteria bacterium]|nr:hypothetical protein [Actinomycetota bacterium]
VVCLLVVVFISTVAVPVGAAEVSPKQKISPQSTNSKDAPRKSGARLASSDSLGTFRKSLQARAPRPKRQTALTLGPAAVLSTPIFSSPAPGAVVSGEVTVIVSSTAPDVQFAMRILDSDSQWITLQTTTQTVSAGVASAVFPTWGFHGTLNFLAQDVVVGTYGSAASLSVEARNPAPVLIRPISGEVFTGSSFEAEATAGGGGVRFLVDGAFVGDVSNAPYVATISTADLSFGSHSVSAVQCDSSFYSCDWANVSNVANIRVGSLKPRIRAISPGVFSPNNDGTSDVARVVFVLDRTQKVVVRVKDQYGNTVRGPSNLGTLGAGVRSWVWNGKSNTVRTVSNGRYSVELSSSATINGVRITGSATREVRVDTSRPRMSGVRPSSSTFYPYKDNYRDYTTLRGYTNEYARAVTVQVFNSSNRIVRSISESGVPAGYVGLSWNGRSNSGAPLPAGLYKFRFLIRDSAGNLLTTGKVGVVASAKKVTRVAFTQTMSASDAFDEMTSGSYYESSSGNGSQLLWGDPFFDDPDIALYSWPLPSSIRGYSQVLLEVCSAREGYSLPLARAGYVDANTYDGSISYVTDLGDSSDTCYGLDGYSPSSFRAGRTLAWIAGNTDIIDLSYWDLAGFRISGYRYVIK